MTTVINLGEIRAERHAVAVATAVLANLAVIQDRLIGYFHADVGNPATDAELGTAGLLCALAEQLELAARTLQQRRLPSVRRDQQRRMRRHLVEPKRPR